MATWLLHICSLFFVVHAGVPEANDVVAEVFRKHDHSMYVMQPIAQAEGHILIAKTHSEHLFLVTLHHKT